VRFRRKQVQKNKRHGCGTIVNSYYKSRFPDRKSKEDLKK